MKLVISKTPFLSVSMWTDAELKSRLDAIQAAPQQFWDETGFETGYERISYRNAQVMLDALTITDVSEVEQQRLAQQFGTTDFTEVGEENLIYLVMEGLDTFEPTVEEDDEDEDEDEDEFEDDEPVEEDYNDDWDWDDETDENIMFSEGNDPN